MLEALILCVALPAALALRPWRLLQGAPALATPLLTMLLVLPWLWALPSLHRMPLQLQWSGAMLVLLMFGWPLAVPLLVAIGVLAWAISPMPPGAALGAVVWLGIVPATLALLLGAALRRWLPAHPFVYVLGRGFLGAVLCLFAAAWLAQRFGTGLPGGSANTSLVARWLMAWGDGFVTGMLTAVFVAYKPQWLLTWSDARYLRR